MSRLALLRSATTINQLADLLGVTHSGLSFVLYKKPAASKYLSFTIPKKSSGVRTIHAPSAELKLFQRRLATLLQECLDEIEAGYRSASKDKRPEKISHGFHPGRSIITNAIQHRRRRSVLNVDLEDFFGTCNFGRVRGLLLKNRNFLLHERVATAIAHLACHEGKLPQGAPSSPVFSNLIGRVLDFRLVKLANTLGCSYSRYVDDLTFSTNERHFPAQLALEMPLGSGHWTPGPGLLREIASSGFSLNPKKTRMQLNQSRQMVTGLVVNSRVNVRSDYRHLVRAMVHRLLTKGEFEISTAAGPIKGTMEQLQGMLSFIDSIDEFNRKRFKARNAPFPRHRDESFRDFMFFRHVNQASRPTLICEGKTDNVYLTHAIRALARSFPDLAAVNAGGEVEIKVRRLKYMGTLTGKMLGLFGGTGDLAKFIASYGKLTDKKFKAGGHSNPVIIVIDNDDGAKPVYSALKSLTKRSATGSEEFIHVFDNLYIVATPLPDGATKSMIEDFFQEETRATQLSGKRFDPASEGETETTYSKAAFAYKVVEAAPDKIDFLGFHPLLERIRKAMADYAAKTSAANDPAA